MRSHGRATAIVSAVVGLLALVLVVSASSGHRERTSVSAREPDVPTTVTSIAVHGAIGEARADGATSTTATEATPSPSTTDDTSAPAEAPVDESSVAPSPEPTTTSPAPAPAYGPDAFLALFPSDAPGMHSVWAVNPDGSGKTKLVDAVDAWYVDWAPGHQQLLWGSAGILEGGRQVHIVNVDGSGERVLVQRPVDGSDIYPFYGFAWSPDGRSIAEFCSSPSDWQVRDLCIVDVATGDLHDLVREYGLIDPEDRNEWGEAPSISFGDWDPSGDRLSYFVYTSDSTGERTSMGILDLRSGAHSKVVAPASFGGVFTSDGLSLLYRASTDSPLYRIPVDGGAAEEVAGSPWDAVSRSPDGQSYLTRLTSTGPPYWGRTNLHGDVERLDILDGAMAVSW